MTLWQDFVWNLQDERLPLVLILGAMFTAGVAVPVSMYLALLRISRWPRLVGAHVTGLCVAIGLLVVLTAPPRLEHADAAKATVPRIAASIDAPPDTQTPPKPKKVEPRKDLDTQTRETGRPMKKVSKSAAKSAVAQLRRAVAPQNRLRPSLAVGGAAGIGIATTSSFGARGGRLEMSANEMFDEFAEEALEYVEYEEERQRSMRQPVGARTAASRERGRSAAGGIKSAQPLYSPKPRYPQKARKDSIEGFVIVSVLVSRTGSVQEFQIIAAEPEGIFEAAVKEILPQWKFSPARDDDGRPIETREEFTLVFELEDAAP